MRFEHSPALSRPSTTMSEFDNPAGLSVGISCGKFWWLLPYIHQPVTSSMIYDHCDELVPVTSLHRPKTKGKS
jgi:hypothetical protein